MKRIHIASPLPDTLLKAVKQLQAGGLVILVDSHDREDEADLIASAEKLTPEVINFMVTHGRGLVCAPMSHKNAQRLGLHIAEVKNPRMLQHCNFTQSVDARDRITTGISAADRAYTIRLLASEKSMQQDFSTPGHVFPLIGKSGGVLERAGHTEGTIYLMKLAGLAEVGTLCEIMDTDGTMLRGKRLISYAKKHKLPLITIEELIAYAKTTTNFIKREVVAPLPTPFGDFQMYGYHGIFDKKEHVALVLGQIKTKKPPLVRIHSECLTGDVFGSQRCDCNEQLYASLDAISEEGAGILLYLRHEGRGIGLINKLKAYNLQDQGLDTYEANEKLGFKADCRDFEVARDMLKDLGVTHVRLMTNSPAKMKILNDSGIKVVERIALTSGKKNPRLAKYLGAKKKKMGHLL